MYFFKKLILYFLLITSQLSNCKTIIWDLGDTLFTTSRLQIAWNIGFSYFIDYMLFDWKSPDIQPIIFDILEKMDPSNHDREIATDNEGRPLPLIFDKWLTGLIKSKELIRSINDYIDQLDKKKYFISHRQKELVRRTFKVIFNPEILAKSTYPIMEGIELLKECYDAKNKDGSYKNLLLILSNWDEASFNLLKQHYKYIFDKYFDRKDIVISGAIGLIKPSQEAFRYVLKTYELDPKDCIFIDDQYDNIVAAQEVGMTALLLCPGGYSALRQILIKLNVLQ